MIIFTYKPQRLIIWLSLLLVGSFLIIGHARADARYGDNNYGACPYGQACPATTTLSPTPTDSGSPPPATTNSAIPTTNPSTPGPSTTRSPLPFVPGSATTSPSSGPDSTRKNFGSELDKTRFGRFVQQQPATLPILFFILLLIMALILMIQAGLEHRNIIRMRRALQRLANIQTDVKNFLQILQHNLRTPLATMLMSLELLKSRRIKPAETAYELVGTLNESVNHLIDEVVSALERPPLLDPTLQASMETPTDTIKSRLFWAPAVTVAALSMLYHMLTWRLFSLRFETQLIILEVAVAFAAVIVLFAGVGYYRRTRARRTVLNQVAVDVKQLERHRTAAVTRLQTELRQEYDVLPSALAKLPESHEAMLVLAGSEDIGRLLQKLVIVEQLQNPDAFRTASMATYDITQELQTVIERVQAAHTPKPSIDFDLTQVQVHSMMGFAGLVDFVLAAALDNAVRYNQGNDVVRLTLRTQGNQTIVQTINQADGITQADTAKMFEPFVRSGDSLKMQTKGTGMSLYVAQVIMRRIGGNISLSVNKQTKVTCRIEIPIRVQPDVLEVDSDLLSGTN